jgi:hypothetical protein
LFDIHIQLFLFNIHIQLFLFNIHIQQKNLALYESKAGFRTLSLPCGNSQVVIRFRRRGGVVPEGALESNVMYWVRGTALGRRLRFRSPEQTTTLQALFDLRLICARIAANSPAA